MSIEPPATQGVPQAELHSAYAIETFEKRFPTVPHGEILNILIDARRSVDLFGLAPAAKLEMADKIAVEQLKQRTGTSSAGALARLDPEKHPRKSSPAADRPA